jgi:hypothetical protein
MNERIETLAKVAGYDMINKAAMRSLGFDVEKFAELIVRECLNIAANADMTELEGPDPEDVLYVACKQVKKHFGVEE